MTRTAPSFEPRQSSSQGQKRKGKPVEVWMLELDRASQDGVTGGAQSLDLTTIEQIADGVEQMVFSWGLQKQERGLEYAELSKSLAKTESPHVPLLPWSFNKTGELPQARTPVVGTKRASSKRAQAKQSGHRWLDCFDRSVSPVTASENSQSPRAGNSPQANGVLKASNRMRNCTGQKRGGMVQEFEDSTACLQAVAPEPDRKGWSMELEIGKDDYMNSDMSSPPKENLEMSKKEGDDPVNGNEGGVRDSCLGNRPFVWTPETEAATPTPERSQQSMALDQMRGQYPPSILMGDDPAGNASPLLSQSPLCAQSPSARHEAAQNSAIISNAHHDDVEASLGDLPMGLPINANGPESSTPLLPLLDATPSCGEDTESVEVGGHTIKVTALRGSNDVLEDKFQALVNINACTLGVQEEHQLKPGSSTSDVEELQIALLECAMEYEIKTIEANLKMQGLKWRGQQSAAVAKSCEVQPCAQKVVEPAITSERTMDYQRLQQLKKQMAKLQHEKNSLSNELHALRDKERQFERQKRSLEDALLRVNRLQREVMKKEHEVVEWQLKEKETKAQLQEVGEKLRRERHKQEPLPLEPKKLLKLLPALREWLRSVKKVGLAKAAERRQNFQDKEEEGSTYPYTTDAYNLQPSIQHSRDKGGISGVSAHMSVLGQLSEEPAHQSKPTLTVNQVDKVICCLAKEIHALQKELTKLARS